MPGTVLINSQGVAEELAPEHVESALQSGYSVPLIDSQGNPIAAPYEEAKSLVAQGTHAQPSEQQLHGLLEDAHYGSAGQQALAFVEGALNPATLGGYGKVAEGLGLTTEDDMRKRAEHNPGTAALGQVAGTVGSLALLPEASIPGLISKAGNAVKAGIAAEGIVGKAAVAGLQGVLEGAAYQAQNEISEHMLGDPNQSAESVLSHIGLAGVLGGSLNLAMAPFASIASKKAEQLGKLLEEAGPSETQVFDPFTKQLRTIAEETPELSTKDILKNAAKHLSPWDILNPTHAIKTIGTDVVKQLIKQSPEKGALISSLATLSNMAIKTSKSIEKLSGAIFAGPLTESLTKDLNESEGSPEELNKLGTLVMNYSTNPEALIEKLSQSTAPISETAPNTMDALSAGVGKAVNFLAPKVPTPQKPAPLDPELPPAKAEITKFNRYANIVDNPVSVLRHVKNGTVLPQDLETLNIVYPTLYNQMKQAVMDNMITTVSKKPAWEIPYKTRLGLSMFLGQNLDSSLSPQSIQFSQLALTQAAQEQAQKQQMQTRPSKVGMRQMNFNEYDQTRAQKSATRSHS